MSELVLLLVGLTAAWLVKRAFEDSDLEHPEETLGKQENQPGTGPGLS